MAILKHIPMKNADYGKAIRYLIFQHDEFTQKEITNEAGKPLMREEFYFDGINCDPYAYDAECAALNRVFHKNQNFNDVKQHHYIISFDPKDVTECGLTGEKAQALGMSFARKNFPGHQTLVCTHPDGHNKSGNIHVHIIFNSLRKHNVDKRHFMERPCDQKAGYKHHETKKLMAYLKQDLMNLCKQENLHQVDLLKPAREHITTKEYYVKKRNEDIFDKIIKDAVSSVSSEKESAERKPFSKFQTQKDELRHAIRDAAANAIDENTFQNLLWQKYQITMKVSRGKFSYLHPDRQKAIRGRALGADYEDACLKSIFENNRLSRIKKVQPSSLSSENERTSILKQLHDHNKYSRNASTLQEQIDSIDKSSEPHDRMLSENNAELPLQPDDKTGILALLHAAKNASPAPIYPYEFTMPTRLRLVVNLQSNAKAAANAAYARKVRLSNLQSMAQTIAFIQENGIDTRENLSLIVNSKREKNDAALKLLNSTNKKLRMLNEQIHFTGAYLSTRNTYRAFLRAENKGLFRSQHAKEIDKHLEARDYLKSISTDEGLPSLEKLKEQKEQLLRKRDKIKENYNRSKKELQLFDTVAQNVDHILSQPKTKEKGIDELS